MTTQKQLLGNYIVASKANEIIMRKCIRSLADKGNKGAELIRTMRDVQTGEDISSKILMYLLENITLDVVPGDGFVMFDSSPVWDNNEVWKITSRHLYGLNKDANKVVSSDADEVAEILTQLAQVKNQKSVEWNIMHAMTVDSINEFLIKELTETQRNQLLVILRYIDEQNGKYNGVVSLASNELGISKSAITQSMKLIEKKWRKRFDNWKPNTSYNKDKTYPKGQTLAKLERNNRKERSARTITESRQDAEQGKVIQGLSATKGNNFSYMYKELPPLTDEQKKDIADYEERKKRKQTVPAVKFSEKKRKKKDSILDLQPSYDNWVDEWQRQLYLCCEGLEPWEKHIPMGNDCDRFTADSPFLTQKDIRKMWRELEWKRHPEKFKL